MINFDRKNTWVLLFTFVSSSLLAAIFIGEGVTVWNTETTKSSAWIALAGVTWQAAGFIVMLNPWIIKIFHDKESHFRYEGIGLILLGIILQGIAASRALFD